MLRQIFAAAAACMFLAVPTPAIAAPITVDAPFEIAAKADKDDDDDKKKVTGKTVVRMNTKTKVYHVKGCDHYDGKNTERMKVSEAKKDGGKPCKLCIKK